MNGQRTHDLINPTAAESQPVLSPGRNCSAISIAHRAAVLIDGASYFAALDATLRSAERSITIIGWDFDASIRLRPQDGPNASVLGDLLRDLVEKREDLHVRVLIWSLATVHTPSAAMPLLVGSGWADHERIHLHLDTHHPLYASHHQKIVIVDDAVVFVGGMDLTVARWDKPEHSSDEPLRKDTDGTPYEPVHDVQMVLDGPVVSDLCTIAHSRWYDATGEALSVQATKDRWPRAVKPDFENISVAVSQTKPKLGAQRGIEEAAQLTDDLLEAARETIYIEAQYFTGRRMGRMLKRLLAQPEGPEIVVICTLIANGILERFIMGANRERLLRRLKAVDRHNRLHVYCPVTDNDEKHRLLIHSKVMIIDDRFLRIGSANLNNRSVGLDTECDVTVIAQTQQARDTIHRMRDTLLGEHLGVAREELQQSAARKRNLRKIIDGLLCDGKSLRPVNVGPGKTRSFPGTFLLDPERPLPFLNALHKLWSRVARRDPVREKNNSEPPKTTNPAKRGMRK